MKRVVFAGLFALICAVAPMSAKAVPAASPTAIGLVEGDSSIVLVKGGHGGGRGHMGRGGRGHHYGWSRGRGHHYGRRH